MLIVLLVLCLYLVGGDGSIVEGSCIETERKALLAIKADIYDPDRWLSSWRGSDCCRWRGVGCDSITGHVVKLDLKYPYNFVSPFLDENFKYSDILLFNPMKYPSPSKVNPSLLDLMHLKYLDLSLNNFAGAPMPKFIGSLVHLEYLNLSYTGFNGSIPPELGNLSSLHFLDVSWNSYYNFINSERTSLRADSLRWLSNIPSLHLLDLSDVDLSKAANWLHEISMLPSLLYLHMSNTDLPVVSTSISHVNLTSLTMLDLSRNYHVTATISRWLFNISSLVHLDLQECDLSHRLLFDIGNLHNLHILDLSYNQITVEFFHYLGNLSYLEHLCMASNMINGEIPKSIGNLRNLVELDLSNNQITRVFSQNLGNLSHLEHLRMASNRINEKIPKSIGNLRNLVELDLSNNYNISGEISEFIGDLIHLQVLDLSGNEISGEIPEIIGNLIHLQTLGLSENKISGGIPQFIGNLIHLQVLDLSGNEISHEIPEIIGNLIHLQTLDLSENKINGEIPDLFDNLHGLHYLVLGSNNITGKIPRSIGNLCKLRYLHIHNNNITGELADTIECWSKCIENRILDGRISLQGLALLDVSYNNLSGTIPQTLGQLSALQRLYLTSNSFTGCLTEAHFANLTRLLHLDLSYNSFEVSLNQDWIPPFNAITIEMCSCHLGPEFPTWLRTQTNLFLVNLCENDISDGFPASFWDLNKIFYLNASHNSITGQLPTSLGDRYEDFDVSSNNIHGPIPQLGLSSLNSMILSNNSFSGPIPLTFAKATNLRFLILSHNHINGSIPQFLCNLSSLKVLDLSNNNLSGGIQLFFSSMASLEVLDLSNNKLFGELHHCQYKPRQGMIDSWEDSKLEHSSGLMACPVHLKSLHLRNNRLFGKLPSLLKYCKQLVILDLSENRFSGDLSIWIGENLRSLRVLSFRSNFFNGSIPVQLSNLTSLQVLDLACNNFSGVLPPSFGNFSGMKRMKNASQPMLSDIGTYYTEGLLITTKGIEIEYTSVLALVMGIDLSQNNFSGTIPTELVKLHGLRFLNLSNNHLIGKIPENIGELRQLESLDLSVNNLSGMIPSTISSMYSLSHLNLSNNNFSGRIPWGNQLQTFCDPSIYSGNPDLRGWPLPWCFGDAPSKSPFPTRAQEVEPGNKDESEMIWLYATTALGFVVGLFGFIYVLMIKRAIRIAYFHLIDAVYDYIYVQLAMRFAKLKPILTTLMNNNQG